jgi:hypothetical protein
LGIKIFKMSRLFNFSAVPFMRFDAYKQFDYGNR